MLDKQSYFNLINAANITSGLLEKNLVKSESELGKFKDTLEGLPILIAADHKIFSFSKDDVFKLNKIDICRTVYSHSDTSYIGFKHAYPGNTFLSQFSVRPEFQFIFDEIVLQNYDCIEKIKLLKERVNCLGAFQTRNIPHSGHEAIIKTMLTQCEHVVINPVMGPKKKDDIKLNALQEIFSDLSNRKYKGKISFMPFFANMFYAGPREAIHHIKLRQSLGFDLFSVGRDHAGAQGIYAPSAATELVQKNSSKFKISVMCHNGGAYCTRCERALLIGECSCDQQYLHDIAGTKFRSALKEGRIFDFADYEMQKYLIKNNMDIFEK